MQDNVFRFSPLDGLIRRLRKLGQMLSAPKILEALRHCSEQVARDLFGAILAIYAFLEDSISNPYLGNLFDRTGDTPLNTMRDRIARAYEVGTCFLGTTGTTGLNTPAVMALAGDGEVIVVGRDCHVSVLAGLGLSGARPVYLVPHFHSTFGVLLPPTRQEVAELLAEHPEVRALVLTLPTYHGLMGDVVGIVAECQERGVLLMVDEAHGPHYRFLRGLGFPISAEEAGADLVTQSTHKVMSALNQGSLLLLKKDNTMLCRRYEEFQAMGFQSTSFSYPILLSIEHAVDQMLGEGEEMWRDAVELACRLRKEAGAVPGIVALDERIVDGSRVVGLDPTRVTLNVRDTGFTGREVAEALLNAGYIVELDTPDVVLFLVSPATTRDQVDGTLRTLRKLGRRKRSVEAFVPPPLPQQVTTPRQAIMSAARERVPVEAAIGRVSAETIGCFPPGQAILVAGEIVTEEVVSYLKQAVAAGSHLKRVQDDGFQTIEVLRDGGPR